MAIIEKTTWEEYPVDMDYTNARPTTATTLSSATVTAYSYSPSTPETKTVDTSIFSSTTCSIIGSLVARFSLKAGEAGKKYLILVRGVFNDGSKIECQVSMAVNGY